MMYSIEKKRASSLSKLNKLKSKVQVVRSQKSSGEKYFLWNAKELLHTIKKSVTDRKHLPKQSKATTETMEVFD